MYALSLGVQRIGETLPDPVYALLSGLNASTVGIIAVAAVQVSLPTRTSGHGTDNCEKKAGGKVHHRRPDPAIGYYGRVRGPAIHRVVVLSASDGHRWEHDRHLGSLGTREGWTNEGKVETEAAGRATRG